ncbi:hypothetical protein [Nocardia vinacea]|uniref:hypothetical protein n=1 Tax=Nocardia vinacea TaxID=96468 RepID=UPI0005931C6F|nr:hypothetical protein [Nocardia vinacea]
MDEFEDAYQQFLSELEDLTVPESAADDALHFQSGVSYGHYRPGDTTLSLAGADTMEHHVTHIHEIHHKALNDSTAWGSALHFAHEYQPWAVELFGELLGASRYTHEVFATFSSINLAEVRYPNASSVLSKGGAYEAYYNRAAVLVQQLEDPIRKDSLLTAITRASMQTPILSLAASAFPGEFKLSDIPNVDRPDRRFSLLLRDLAPRISELARQADTAISDRFGNHTLQKNTAYGGVDDPLNDEAWRAWEQVVYDECASHLSERGATVLPWDGHIEATRQVADLLASAGHTRLRVNPAGAPAPTSYDESVAMLAATRFPFRNHLWPASFGYMKGVIDPEDFMHVITHVASVDGVPDLVFHARLAGRLLESYEWDEQPRKHLESLGNSVVVSVKCRTNIGDSDDFEIFHVGFREPADMLELLDAWKDRGPYAFCVAASCYTDPHFAAHWIEPTRKRIPTVVLLDVPTNTLIGPEKAMLPSDRQAYGIYWNLTGTPYTALIWHVDGQTHLGMYIGDDLATQLTAGQFEDIMGQGLTMQDVDWLQWERELSAVIRSIISCESYVDQRALESLRPDSRDHSDLDK